MTQASSVIPVSGRGMTVGELAARVQGALDGDADALIHGASSIEDAETGDIVFAENPRFLTQAIKSRASAIVAFLDAVTPDKPLIRVNNPRFAFAKILEMFAPVVSAPPGIHPTAIIGTGVQLGEGSSVGPHVVIGDHAQIGPRVRLLAGCNIGEECVLGADCLLYPNVTLYQGVTLGERVTIHSGTVLGADGFGYVSIGGRNVKVPQVGTVEIGDDVEIGANCTVDRAKTGSTVIGARTKIDNLVHIAHNVKTGTDCVIVAQVGVAGSVQLGSGVMLAGQAGLKDHIAIGDRAIVLAQAGVFGDIPAGTMVSGYPARPHRERLKQDAAAARLPDYVTRLRALERANTELTERNARLERLATTLAQRLGIDIEE